MLLPARPLVPIALAFGAGILLGGSLWAVVVLALAGVSAAAVYFPRLRFLVRFRSFGHGVVLLGFAAAGALRQLATQSPTADDVSQYIGSGFVTVRGTVAGDVETGPRTLSFELEAQSVIPADGTARPCSGRAALTLVRLANEPMPDFGDAIEARGRLERPPPATNPGGFDLAAYLSRRGVFATLYVRRPGAASYSQLSSSASSAMNWPLRVAGRLRRSVVTTFGAHLPPTETGLLSGILIGSRSSLPPSVADDFQLTGTSHVLATAGLHVGLIALLLNSMLRLCRVSRGKSAGLTIALLVLYAMMAGGRPSVLRAVLVADLFLAGYLLDREPDATNSLAAAAILLLAYRPGSLFDPGFQLSFATVGSILAIMSAAQPFVAERQEDEGAFKRGWARIFSRLKVGLFNVALLTVAAQIGSTPLVARYFNLISPSGLPANALIVPALVPILGLGFALWFTAALGIPILPGALSSLLHPLLAYVIGAVRFCSELPYAAIAVSSPGWPLIALYYAILAVTVRHFRIRARHPVAAVPIVPTDAPVEAASQ